MQTSRAHTHTAADVPVWDVARIARLRLSTFLQRKLPRVFLRMKEKQGSGASLQEDHINTTLSELADNLFLQHLMCVSIRHQFLHPGWSLREKPRRLVFVQLLLPVPVLSQTSPFNSSALLSSGPISLLRFSPPPQGRPCPLKHPQAPPLPPFSSGAVPVLPRARANVRTRGVGGQRFPRCQT